MLDPGTSLFPLSMGSLSLAALLSLPCPVLPFCTFPTSTTLPFIFQQRLSQTSHVTLS